jgi:hypothetical protein
MSWSFPDRPPTWFRTLDIGRGLLFAVATLATPVIAAEIYVQPIATLTAETDSNVDLLPSIRQEVQGYLADVATIVGIATPDSNTILKPRVVYQYYPRDSADDVLEGYLNFNTNYRTQRSKASFAGGIQHVDEFNAELSSAQYNDINPGQPTVVDTGKVIKGATRDSANLFPTYAYSLTPVVDAGVSGQYQLVNYSPTDITSHSNYRYYLARAFVSWSFSQTSDVSLGGYGSKYEATQIVSQATGTGATLDFDTKWTPAFSTKASLVDQRTSIHDVLPTPLNAEVNAWGATVAATYIAQVDQFRLNAGRSISPSGGGGMYDVDTLQFQYDRKLSARLSFMGALLGLRANALTANIAGNDHKYAETIVEMKWLMSPTWYVQGGYQYAWQKYQSNLTSAVNNRIYIEFGYKGLGQQR